MMERAIPLPLSERFEEALLLVVHLHAHQSRKGTTRPYTGHLLGVTSLVLQYGGGEEEAIAALLHDAIEDHPDRISLEDIQRKFGEKVARIVAACTDSFSVPRPQWRERKQAYVAHIREKAPDERLVSAADKLYNVREIMMDYRIVGERLFERFAAQKNEVLWYYRELAHAFVEMGDGLIAEELDRSVKELNHLVGSQA